MVQRGVVSKNDIDAQCVASIDFASFVDGLCAALEHAIRNGVPVQHQPDLHTFEQLGVTTIQNLTAQRIRSIRATAADARRRAEGAEAIAAESKTTDPEESARYQEVARVHRNQQAHSLHELEDLQNTPARVPTQEPYDVMTHTWLPAIAALRHSDGRLDEQTRHDLNRILPHRRFHFRNGNWWAEVTLRVTAKGGKVAELGPIDFELPGSGNNNKIFTLLAGQQPLLGVAVKRVEVSRKLVDTGRVSMGAARAAANTLFPHIPALLLHHLAGEPLPDWVTGRWLEPAFADHLVATYSAQPWDWSNLGRWTNYSPLRQALAHLVCDARNELNLVEIRTKLALRGRKQLLTLNTPPRAGQQRAWLPPYEIVRWGRKVPDRDCRIAPIMCACGEPARIVSRLPEVPRDLLCQCGRMPEATRFGIDPDLLFPEEYLRLEVPMEWCATALRDDYEFERTQLKPALSDLLTQIELLQDGSTADQIAAALNRQVNNVRVQLRSLAQYGYVSPVSNPDKRVAPVWRYTVDGKGFAELLISRKPRATQRYERDARRADNAARKQHIRQQAVLRSQDESTQEDTT